MTLIQSRLAPKAFSISVGGRFEEVNNWCQLVLIRKDTVTYKLQFLRSQQQCQTYYVRLRDIQHTQKMSVRLNFVDSYFKEQGRGSRSGSRLHQPCKVPPALVLICSRHPTGNKTQASCRVADTAGVRQWWISVDYHVRKHAEIPIPFVRIKTTDNIVFCLNFFVLYHGSVKIH